MQQDKENAVRNALAADPTVSRQDLDRAIEILRATTRHQARVIPLAKAATIIGASRYAVHRLITRGDLEGVKGSGRKHIGVTKESLDRFTDLRIVSYRGDHCLSGGPTKDLEYEATAHTQETDARGTIPSLLDFVAASKAYSSIVQQNATAGVLLNLAEALTHDDIGSILRGKIEMLQIMLSRVRRLRAHLPEIMSPRRAAKEPSLCDGKLIQFETVRKLRILNPDRSLSPLCEEAISTTEEKGFVNAASLELYCRRHGVT